MESKNDKSLATVLLETLKYFVRFWLVAILIACFLVVFGYSVFAFRVASGVQYTEITELTEYGVFTGTNNNAFTEQFINSFFPHNLDPVFSNIKYSYKAENVDNYGFEAYLEVTIEDPELFEEYVAEIAEKTAWKEFVFDNTFMEYNLDNVLDIYVDNSDNSGEHHQIEQAKIRTILYSKETQTIIFVALGVYEGGGIDTGYLSTFFNRFSIDPIEYEQQAETPYGIDPYIIN